MNRVLSKIIYINYIHELSIDPMDCEKRPFKQVWRSGPERSENVSLGKCMKALRQSGEINRNPDLWINQELGSVLILRCSVGGGLER